MNLSTGKIAQQIGELAISKGWESWIAYSGREKSVPSKSNLIRVGNYFDACVHFSIQKFFDNEGLNSSYYTKKLLKAMDKIQPDIVQLHNIHDHWLNYKILFSYLAEKNIPVVWTQHDQWAITGHCMYNLCGCERWKNECYDCPLSKWYSLDRSRRNHQLKKKMLANIPSLTIVPVSDWLGNIIRWSHLKDRPMQVIHNGIDIQTFSPQPKDAYERYSIDLDKKIVLWNACKGVNDFYELATHLSKRDYVIVIVGQLAEEPKQVDGCQIIFINRTQSALELAQLYFSASVFVNPTCQDNYLTTNLEVLACGTPVITYRTEGTLKFVDDTIGMVVNQGDIKSLLIAVKHLSDKHYSDQCRKRAESEYDNSMCFNPYILLYNKLLNRMDEDIKVILGVSNIWSNDKGLSDMIALSRDQNNIVILVGMSKDQVKEYSSEKYKNCNLIPIQRTHNQNELAMLYSLAHVYVNPTYADMFPTVNLEALACGTPVITYCTGGSPEAVDERTGIVIEQGDLISLTDAIKNLRKYSLLSEDCRQRAEVYFDKNRCFERYFELYKDLLAM